MKWTVFTITTTVDAEDYVCAALAELGYEGVEIIDSVPLTKEEEAAQFIDIPLVTDTTDRTSKIRCYAEIGDGESSGNDVQSRVSEIRESIEIYSDIVPLGDLTIETTETEDLDWINNWKQFFHSFRIGDDILIKPTWEENTEVQEGDLVIEIDPGTAFGTGSHETTWLCIEALRAHVKEGDVVLDIGCGSGILAIIAKKLGAGCCIGVDIDPIAVDVAKENAVQNKLTIIEPAGPQITEGTVSFFAGDVITDRAFAKSCVLQKYPIVVANILADVIKPMMPVVKDFIAEGGCFITSGILREREEEMVGEFERNGYRVTERRYKNDWVSLTAELK
ncbi:MAG: 50S ribosomal protein L11 methyltransferase [Lachnospiraceae bacterium]|nr:50S ribosomal protein L11 methyltransferase [Lachnospiraceae bacterium]